MRPPFTFAGKPWLLIVVAFVILIVAWTALIVIAERNAPESIPLEVELKDAR